MPDASSSTSKHLAAATGGTLASQPGSARQPAARSWVDPKQLVDPGQQQQASRVLSEEQVAAWRRNGWLLVDGVLSAQLAADAAADGATIYPAPSESRSAEELAAGQVRLGDGGNSVSTDFPYNSRALNDVVVNLRMLRAASQLLGTDDIRLTQAGFGYGPLSLACHRLCTPCALPQCTPCPVLRTLHVSTLCPHRLVFCDAAQSTGYSRANQGRQRTRTFQQAVANRCTWTTASIREYFIVECSLNNDCDGLRCVRVVHPRSC